MSHLLSKMDGYETVQLSPLVFNDSVALPIKIDTERGRMALNVSLVQEAWSLQAAFFRPSSIGKGQD